MKKIKFISVFIMFAISFLAHFMYDFFPNILTTIFFPVNESIWEHMKIILTSTLIYSIFEYIYFHKKNICVNNYIFAIFITSIIGIIFYLLIYLPLDKLFGHSMIVAIIILFITFIIIAYLNYKIITYKEIKYSNSIAIILLIFVYIIFAYLSYNPIKNNLFYDTENKLYGIKNKGIK